MRIGALIVVAFAFALAATGAEAGTGSSLLYTRLVSQTEIVAVAADGSTSRVLTSNALDRMPALSADGTQIAFARHVDGWQIFVQNVDGSTPRQLTSDGDNVHPTWSPDGRSIAFTHLTEHTQQVWTVGSDGTGMHPLVPLASGNSFDPAWSPDGHRVAFASDGGDGVDIAVIDVANPLGVSPLTHNGGDTEPVWAPDGKSLVFSRGPDWRLFRVTLDGTVSQLTNTSFTDSAPAFSGDGRSLLFARSDGDATWIEVQPWPAGTAHRLAQTAASQFDPSPGPGGTILAVTNGHAREQLFASAADGTDERRLAVLPYDVTSPDVSPDGRHIAVAAVVDGRSRVEILDRGGRVERVLHLGAPAGFPHWSPDGRRLLIAVGQPLETHLVVCDADGSHVRVLAPRLALRQGTNDWSPDGRKIVFTGWDDGPAPPELYVIGADGKGLRPLTSGAAWAVSPAWSPDGSTIAFERKLSGSTGVWTIHTDGTKLFALAGWTGDAAPVWSRDGRSVLVVRGDAFGAAGLLALTADAGDETRLVDSGPALVAATTAP